MDNKENMARDVIASVGAGRMGRGIAITFAMAGFEVRLIDAKERSASEFDVLQKSASTDIQKTANMLADIGLLSKASIHGTIERISFYALTDCDSALATADVVFEAVPETLAAKEAALKLVSRLAQPGAIVASTTSTILSDDLQPFVLHPSRFLNAHWLNPAFLVPLVEISPGHGTDPAVVQRLNLMLETIGKVPVVCSASPGYIVPRIQALAMNEAARMVEEGVATVEDIDKATRYGFGFRFAILGLLEFIDWGGGDILYHASRYMTNAMDSERFAAPAIIESNMKEGRIGLSTRKGFLDYSQINVDKYQREKLAEFVAMLRHIGKLPTNTMTGSRPTSARAPSLDAQLMIRKFLKAIEKRKLDEARVFLASGFSATFPGGNTFTTLPELVNWSKTRYKSVAKTFERFDQSQSDQETVVYCHGTLNGLWLDNTPFSDVRFVDRFVIADGLIQSQLGWNDLAEAHVF